MSEKNHPNLRAAGFAVDIVESYYKNLRGKANNNNAPNINDLVQDFVFKVETKVDTEIDLEENFETKEEE